jgi:DNA-damage-inducible protein J
MNRMDIVNKIVYIYIQEEFMAQTNINIRMDTQLKKQFETFCADVGLTMTAAFNVFAKTSVRLQKIPFEITAETDPFYSESNMKVLVKSIKQLEEGKGVEHEPIKA